MTYLSPRKVVELAADPISGPSHESSTIEDYRCTEAYVLLGDPGMGKTTAFKKEVEATANGEYVTARDFCTLEPRPEWQSAVLFIDGLDEIRIGGTDGRMMLDRIRGRLDKLGRPRFRISCRLGSWFAANDRDRLRQVTHGGKIPVILLAPLSDADIGRILDHDSDIEDGTAFLAAADESGIKRLFSNPLNLELAAKWLTTDSSPGTRREIMDRACRSLLKEKNDEYTWGQTRPRSADSLLDPAGYLCALLVFTGSAGYSVNTSAGTEYLDFSELPEHSPEGCRLVLGSRLFRGTAEGVFEPIHRHIAEFLAAKCIAKGLADGLPFGRLASLMSDRNGHVQPAFFGLVAWLSELSPPNRLQLFQFAPFEITSNADIGEFEQHERLKLLTELQNMVEGNPQSMVAVVASPRLGSLVSTDLAPDVAQRLATLEPTEVRQPSAIFFAETLRQSDPIPELGHSLLDAVRRSDWKIYVRLSAIRAAVHHLGPEGRDELARLANEVKEGLVRDEAHHILGFVLPKLYPHMIEPPAVVEFLFTPRAAIPHSATTYMDFWRFDVIRLSEPSELVGLLDALVSRHDRLIDRDRRTAGTVREVLQIALGYFLPKYGASASPDQLFKWIGTAALSVESRSYDFGFHQEGTRIREFLEFHEDISSKLARMRNDRQSGANDWGLDPLAFLSRYREEVHESESVGSMLDDNFPISDPLEELPRDSSTDLGAPDYLSPVILENVGRAPIPPRPLTDLGKEVLEHVGKPLGVGQEGAVAVTHSVPPNLLHRMAAAYHGIGEEAHGLTPVRRLHHLLGSENGVVESVLKLFRDIAIDSEAPSAREILEQIKQNELNYLVLPCLAGLAEIPEIEWSSDDHQRRALAVYFATRSILSGFGTASTPWFDNELRQRPDLVAKVYVRFATAFWRSQSSIPSELTRIIYEKEYEYVAELVIPALLKSLSVRSRHLFSLQHLLHGAIRLIAPEDLKPVIASKLSAKSMTMAQRVWWLAAGFWIAPDVYSDRLEAFVRGKQRRVPHLVKAIRLFMSTHKEQIPPRAFGVLIRLLAPWYEPSPLFESDSPAHTKPRGTIVLMIRALADWPSESALHSLEQLAQDPSLARWQPAIEDALSTQRELLNTWLPRYPDATQVAEALKNGTPSSAQDLLALTTDVLKGLAQRIRTGHTSDWRQYWNADSHSRPTVPKPENSCRDALASDLDIELRRLNISVRTESRHVDDTRSDILICHETLKIPVEIKRSCHRELWSAIQTQLITKYCADPDSHGFGLYVVFWFGNSPSCRPRRRDGTNPKSAEELESLLMDTLSESDRYKISVAVIDVSQPMRGVPT